MIVGGSCQLRQRTSTLHATAVGGIESVAAGGDYTRRDHDGGATSAQISSKGRMAP
jgi:hypothetical protein